MHGERRHLLSNLPKWKVKRIISNFNNYFVNNLPMEKINFAIDWGCGGGVLTNELKKVTSVLALDICEDSLSNCVKYANPDRAELLPNSLCDFKYNYGKADLILAHAVVWHFPTLEYFKQVVDIWTNDIQATYIAFNTKKITKQNFVQATNYKNDFLDALLLKDEFVIDLFNSKGYSLLFSGTFNRKPKPQTYFIFFKDPRKILIDIDETICTTPGNKNIPRDYNTASPIIENIKAINKLYDTGHHITYWTARGSGTGVDWSDVTYKQLKKWGVKYHKVLFGKPEYDLFIDDKVLNVRDWEKNKRFLPKY